MNKRILFSLGITGCIAGIMLCGVLLYRFVQPSEIRSPGSLNFELENQLQKEEAPKMINLLNNSNTQELFNSIGGSVEVDNYPMWVVVMNKYFTENGSPLKGTGKYFWNACQKYGAPSDCLLLPAISRVETNQCKTDISASQFNCWGFGGSGPNRILYSSFEQSIDEITRRLMSGYGKRFFENANNGALYYCGGHCSSWGDHVEQEKRRINSYFIANGQPSLL